MKLSISIICYKQCIDFLECIASINKYVQNIEYEIIVVMYKVEKDELAKFYSLYGDSKNIRTIINNEFSGFSENQNIALKAAIGEYVLVLNDDTYFVDDSINKLVDILDEHKEIAILSPIILNTDNSVQINGRTKFSYLNIIIETVFGGSYLLHKNRYTNRIGLYKTYNLSGSCFLARRSLMQKLGYFDEKYFFMPEDIALSELANKKGMEVYVNTKAKVFHKSSKSSRPIFHITVPVAKQGLYLFIKSNYSDLHVLIYKIIVLIMSILKLFYWIFAKNSGKNTKSEMIKTHINIIKYIYCPKLTPKQLFVKLYSKNS